MMNTPKVKKFPHAEGDHNLSPRRSAWAARNLDEESRALVEEDSRYFLHQSLSTPCLSAIRKAEGIWIGDLGGRRYMDFHGNNVHHIGYGHPRLIAASFLASATAGSSVKRLGVKGSSSSWRLIASTSRGWP